MPAGGYSSLPMSSWVSRAGFSPCLAIPQRFFFQESGSGPFGFHALYQPERTFLEHLLFFAYSEEVMRLVFHRYWV
jgi:hypothetical protein